MPFQGSVKVVYFFKKNRLYFFFFKKCCLSRLRVTFSLPLLRSNKIHWFTNVEIHICRNVITQALSAVQCHSFRYQQCQRVAGHRSFSAKFCIFYILIKFHKAPRLAFYGVQFSCHCPHWQSTLLVENCDKYLSYWLLVDGDSVAMVMVMVWEMHWSRVSGFWWKPPDGHNHKWILLIFLDLDLASTLYIFSGCYFSLLFFKSLEVQYRPQNGPREK